MTHAYAAYQSQDWAVLKNVAYEALSGYWNEVYAPTADLLTREQISSFLFLAKQALIHHSAPGVDELLRTAIAQREDADLVYEKNPVLLHRSHCRSLVDALAPGITAGGYDNVTGSSVLQFGTGVSN